MALDIHSIIVYSRDILSGNDVLLFMWEFSYISVNTDYCPDHQYVKITANHALLVCEHNANGNVCGPSPTSDQVIPVHRVPTKLFVLIWQSV